MHGWLLFLAGQGPTHMSDDGVERERAVAAEDLHDDTDEEQRKEAQKQALARSLHIDLATQSWMTDRRGGQINKVLDTI